MGFQDLDLPIAAVIFDCDGTLVDSESAGLDVLHEHAVELGLDLSRERVHQDFRGRRMAESIQTIGALLPHRPEGFAADFERRVRAAMAQRFRADLQAMPGALALLEALRVPFCVATNGPRDKAELTLGLTGLLHHVDGRIFSAYDVGSWKPDPGLFLHAARALGVEPAQCAVVEDSLPGVEAGLAAGMRVYSMCQHGVLPALHAARVTAITGLDELDRILHGRDGTPASSGAV